MNLPSQAALARYGAVKVTTASPAQVLVMLYDGLLRFLRDAQTAMAAKERGRAGERLSKANAILSHLLGSLDVEKAPVLCARLQAVYLFCMNTILKANIAQDAKKLDEAITVLQPLREAWVTAAAEVALAKK
jgi:flagellar protein FliS